MVFRCVTDVTYHLNRQMHVAWQHAKARNYKESPLLYQPYLLLRFFGCQLKKVDARRLPV